MAKIMIHLHIPKCAGGTFKRKYLYGTNWLSDHYPFGIHELCRRFSGNKKYGYVVFLRDPINRWLSHVNYCLFSIPKDHYEDVDKAKELYDGDVTSFLEASLDCQMFANLQTRQLSGIEPWGRLGDMLIKNQWRMRIYNPYSCYTREPYSKNETGKMLEHAKKNIKESVDFVGFIERAKKDFNGVAKKYGLKARKVRNAHVAKEKIPIDMSMHGELLKELNWADIELYNYARSIWW